MGDVASAIQKEPNAHTAAVPSLRVTKVHDGIRSFLRWFVYDGSGAQNFLGRALSFIGDYCRENRGSAFIIIAATAVAIVGAICIGIKTGIIAIPVIVSISAVMLIACFVMFSVEALRTPDQERTTLVRTDDGRPPAPPPDNPEGGPLQPHVGRVQHLGEARRNAERYENFLASYDDRITKKLTSPDGQVVVDKCSIPDIADDSAWIRYAHQETIRLSALQDAAPSGHTILPPTYCEHLYYFIDHIEDEFWRGRDSDRATARAAAGAHAAPLPENFVSAVNEWRAAVARATHPTNSSD